MNKKQLSLFLLLLSLSYCIVDNSVENDQIPGCSGNPNTKPVVTVKPELLKSVQNGKKYLIKNETDYVYVVSLQGSAYQMGYAYGQLMQDEIAANLQNMVKYLLNSLGDFLKQYNVPTFLIEKIQDWAVGVGFWALELNWKIAAPYTPARYDEEFRGIAAGSNGKVNYDDVRRINMIPELTQAACTIVGAWGPATQNGHLLQLRSLDWDSKAPINQFPAVVIYNSTEPGSYIFANIGFAGLTGALTAMSKNGVGIGEKVWYPPKGMSPKPRITYFGKPWAFVLRDLAQFGQNLEQMISTVYNTSRTMRIHIGMSSLPDNSFRGWDYSENVLLNFNDKNYTDYSPAHPQIDGVFYFDKHVQPSNNECIGNILKDSVPNITPATLYQDVAGFHSTGDTQVCAMDLTAGQIWVSYSEFGTNVKAYLRSPIFVDLKSFWGPN